jgi:hypothetical protein
VWVYLIVFWEKAEVRNKRERRVRKTATEESLTDLSKSNFDVENSINRRAMIPVRKTVGNFLTARNAFRL